MLLLTFAPLISPEPQLRLVGGTHNTGRLEIIMDDEIGSICDQGWSRYDATVACRQLGFTGGEYRRYVLAGIKGYRGEMGGYF